MILQLPSGECVTIYSEKGVGKTSFIFSLIKEYQSLYPKLSYLYIDCDSTIYIRYMDEYNLDKGYIFIHKPTSIEECLDTILKFSQSFVNFIIVDKMFYLSSNISEPFKQLIQRNLEHIISTIKKSGTILIFLENTTKPLLNYYSDLVLDFKLIKRIKNPYRYKGNKVEIVVSRNLNHTSVPKQVYIEFGKETKLL